MLAPYLLAVVAVAIVVTSFISGIFGMAGGMLLLGLLLLFMDVAPAMVLFGIIQLAANGWRAVALVAPRRLEHRLALPGGIDRDVPLDAHDRHSAR